MDKLRSWLRVSWIVFLAVLDISWYCLKFLGIMVLVMIAGIISVIWDGLSDDDDDPYKPMD